jgi:hypothetical protein
VSWQRYPLREVLCKGNVPICLPPILFSESEQIAFFIKVTDKGKPPKENLVPVDIFIMNTDLSPPEFAQSQYSYFLPEDTALGTIINTITAQSNATIEYNIVAGNEGTTNNPAKFTIKLDGKLTLIEPLDHEDVNLYILTIQAKMKTNPPLVDYTEVTIHVMDNNDNSPKFEVNPYSVSIAENSDIGTRVIQVKANDKDSGPNADVTYSFADNEATIANVLHLNPHTGWITTLVEQDRETQEKYLFSVIAKDNGSPHMLQDKTVVDIDISDHNDEPPVFSQKHYTGKATLLIKELNPRRRVYVEIPKPSRVELKCNASGFDVELATPERVLVSQHRPDAEGLISILKCLKANIWDFIIIYQSSYRGFSENGKDTIFPKCNKFRV